MRIIFQYKSHLLRPKSHKRCPSIKLRFESIWNIYFVKNFKTSHPNLWNLNSDNQSPTHKRDRVKKSACEEIISIINRFIFCKMAFIPQDTISILSYLIYHPDHLIPTSQPLDQLDHTDHPTKQPDKLPQPTYLSRPPYQFRSLWL